MDVSQGFPVPNAPLLDSRGQLTDAWRRFFLTLWNRTGEGPGISSADLELLISLVLARVDTTQLALTAAQAASLRALTPSVQRNSQALDLALMALLKANTASGGVRTLTQGTGITLTPSPITTGGTIALTVPVAVANGGTGQTTYTDGQLLIGNTTGNTLNKSTLTAGTGITITNSGGGISIAATGSTIPSSGLFAPEGRLTLVTGTPVMTSDQTAKTHVYYTPYVGSTVPIYDGAAWGLQVISSDLDMALDTTNQLLENVYDLFVWNNSSTISIGAGPAWSNAATITVTIATPAVVTWNAHGLYEGAPIIFTTSGALPTGITAGTTYYVGRSPATNTFNIATSTANAAAGTFVNTSGSQSGTHTCTNHTINKRGTGAGTTELQMLNGIWTNKNTITLTNGAGGGNSVAANRATYVGSIYCTANGQTGMGYQPAAATGGSNNFLGVYNAYNRVRTTAFTRDSTATWTYTSTTWRAADNSVNNRLNWLDGLAQSEVQGAYQVSAFSTGNNAAWVGVSLDNTNQPPNYSPQVVITTGGTIQSQLTAADTWFPQLGLHYLQAMESAQAATITFLGAGTSPTRQMNSLQVSVEM